MKHEYICPVCNQKVWRTPANVRPGGVFCSIHCYGQFNTTQFNTTHVVHWGVVADCYRNGGTLKEIGATYGVSAEFIRKRLIAMGVPIRARTYHLSTWKNPTRGKGHRADTIDKLKAKAIQQFSDPAARAKASELQIEAMSNGKIRKVSKVEDKVAAALNELGVSYTRQAPIRCTQTGRFVACVDFQLMDGRVLEVNGTYWHADPRTYPNGPVYQSQKHTVEKYRVKLANLKAMGVQVLEVWEMDIEADINRSLSGVLHVDS